MVYACLSLNNNSKVTYNQHPVYSYLLDYINPLLTSLYTIPPVNTSNTYSIVHTMK